MTQAIISMSIFGLLNQLLLSYIFYKISFGEMLAVSPSILKSLKRDESELLFNEIESG
jgi:hypothetical protein